MRLASGSNRPNQRNFEAFGLARYSLPSGRVLNRVVVEAVPSTHPCWFPDMTARVIYTGGNGRLYRLDFDEADRDGGGDPAPQEVVWECKSPGPGLMLRDPVWSIDPRLGGRLIVSLQYRDDRDHANLTRNRLWWLRLTADGTAIVDAGPLTDPEQDHVRSREGEERYPNVSKSPDGRLQVAYLTRSGDDAHWTLRLAPLALDKGRPVVRSSEARVVADRQAGELSPFSSDGQFIFSVTAEAHGGQLYRFPTEAPLSTTSATASKQALHDAG
jgi:hypothetical protein